MEQDVETTSIHPLAPEHLPRYITAADGSDYLFSIMVGLTVFAILLLGVGYLTLHALPERMAHRANHSQLQIVGILAILALFTHNNLFWIAALLIASFQLPDYLGPIRSMAASLFSLSKRSNAADWEQAEDEAAWGTRDAHSAPSGRTDETGQNVAVTTDEPPSGAPPEAAPAPSPEKS